MRRMVASEMYKRIIICIESGLWFDLDFDCVQIQHKDLALR